MDNEKLTFIITEFYTLEQLNSGKKILLSEAHKG